MAEPLMDNARFRLREIYAAEADPYYLEVLPLILRGYPQITVAAYWDLTAAELAVLAAALIEGDDG